MIFSNLIYIFIMNLNIIYWVIIVAFVVRTLRNSLYHAFLWQIKEYRIDRLKAHLKTPVGRKLLIGPISSAKWVILIFLICSVCILLISNNHRIIPTLIFVSLLFYWPILIIEGILNLKESITYGWRKPKITAKIALVLGFVYLVEFGPILYLDWGGIFILPVLDKILGFLISCLVLIFNIPSFIYKVLVIKRAKDKIKFFPHLKVIGISGSYGKTSTKEFLATVLNEKYKVAKTPGSNNTDIGIAKYILNSLDIRCDIFIVEMGAYKRGEIKAICEIVEPDIGIITGIGEQHLELFGSQEEINKAKFELIDSLSESGLAFFNGNSRYCRQLYNISKNKGLRSYLYQTNGFVRSLEILKNSLKFSLEFKGKIYKFEAHIIGSHNMDNILPSILVSQKLDLTMSQIQRGLSKIVSVDKTMKIVKNNNITYVDDTFNSGKEAVYCAIDYMSLYKGNKILIMTPLIELGIKSVELHRKLGEYASKICDSILLTNSNFFKAVSSGASEKESVNTKVQLINQSIVLKLANQIFKKDSIILFEGRESAKILDQMTKLWN